MPALLLSKIYFPFQISSQLLLCVDIFMTVLPALDWWFRVIFGLQSTHKQRWHTLNHQSCSSANAEVASVPSHLLQAAFVDFESALTNPVPGKQTSPPHKHHLPLFRFQWWQQPSSSTIFRIDHEETFGSSFPDELLLASNSCLRNYHSLLRSNSVMLYLLTVLE